MRKHHLVATVALAVLGLLAPAAQAAGDATARPAAGTSVKKPAKKSARKPVRKAVRKSARKPRATAAAHPPRTGSRRIAGRTAGKAARAPLAAGRSVQLPRRTIAATQPRTDVRARLTRPGDYEFAMQHDGRKRTYRVHVPPGLAPGQPAPLVVALHGRDADGQANAGLYGLARESDRQRFVVVFPDAYHAPGSTGTAWSAGDARGQPVDDVGFIDTVVDNVFRQLPIARLQIYAAGMADGGSMAYRLACERPHLFRAVASVGGPDATTQCAPDKAVSILHFQAQHDARTVLASLPGGGGAALNRDVEAAGATAAKWAGLNGCMETPRRILEMSGAWCESYSYCRQEAEVRLCVTENGGHAWPGALKRRSQLPSHALSATRTMWGFFSTR